jgi:ABC-2 type transport system permease protein
VRSLIITGWDTQALVLGFGIAAAMGVLSIAAASWALRLRLTRT